MWRRQTAPSRPANLCNQFLIEYLWRKKTQLEKSGMQRKALVYSGAIASIRKYPLPIISGQQLKTIYGIGELLSEELVIVIKHHYRDFLKRNPQGNDRPPTHQLTNRQAGTEQNDQESQGGTNSVSLARSTTLEAHHASQQIYGEDSKGSLSVKSATVDRQYKPRAGSLATFVMIAIRNLGRGEFVQQQILKQTLRKEYAQTTGKQYTLAVANLMKSGYVQRDPLEQTYLRLTEKGNTQVQKLENKTKIKESQAKIQGLATSFRENHFLKKSTANIEEKQQKGTLIQTIETSHDLPLLLLIDSREKKDHQQQCFFETRLQDKHGIACRSANLPIGDFVWLYGDQVLDYVVERKKADDLVSSIFDGRYKEQKYRLRNSGFGNVYYLYEGHLTGQNAKSEREAASALLRTRVKDEFRVVRVKSITESVKFLSFLTESILKKINSSAAIKTLGTLDDFAANNGKTCNLTVQHIFGLSLKTIPGVGKASVSQILKYFSSFKSLYDHLKQLDGPLQRVQFLRELLKGCGVSRSVPQILVELVLGSMKK